MKKILFFLILIFLAACESTVDEAVKIVPKTTSGVGNLVKAPETSQLNVFLGFELDDTINAEKISDYYLYVDSNQRHLGTCKSSNGDYNPRYRYGKSYDDYLNGNLSTTGVIAKLNLKDVNMRDEDKINISKYGVFCEDLQVAVAEYVIVVKNDLPVEYLYLALGIPSQKPFIPESTEVFWEMFFYHYLVSSNDLNFWRSIDNVEDPSVRSQGVEFVRNLTKEVDAFSKSSCRVVKREKIVTSIVPGSIPEIKILFGCSFRHKNIDGSVELRFEYSDAPPLLKINMSAPDFCFPSLDNCVNYYPAKKDSFDIQLVNNRVSVEILEFLDTHAPKYAGRGYLKIESLRRVHSENIINPYLAAYYESIDKPALTYWDLLLQDKNLFSPLLSLVSDESSLSYLIRSNSEITNGRQLIINNDRTLVLNLGENKEDPLDFKEFMTLDFTDGKFEYKNLNENLYFSGLLEDGRIVRWLVIWRGSNTNLDQQGVDYLFSTYVPQFAFIVRSMIEMAENRLKIDFPIYLSRYNTDWLDDIHDDYDKLP